MASSPRNRQSSYVNHVLNFCWPFFRGVSHKPANRRDISVKGSDREWRKRMQFPVEADIVLIQVCRNSEINKNYSHEKWRVILSLSVYNILVPLLMLLNALWLLSRGDGNVRHNSGFIKWGHTEGMGIKFQTRAVITNDWSLSRSGRFTSGPIS
jgi:hypothetical protein